MIHKQKNGLLKKAAPTRRYVEGQRFGHIPGIPVGKRFENRKLLSAAHVHPPLVAGIYGRKGTGARSIVLGGHYDDEDHGDTFTYIGSGGREPGVRFGPQTCDQNFDNSLNEALRVSACMKRPVRVIRGAGLKSKYAPGAGFRYDGLYIVRNPRIEMGPNGFKVCKFDFERMGNQPPLPTSDGQSDWYRSDIDVRRSEWKDYRSAAARGQSAGASTSSGGAEGEEWDDDDASSDIFDDAADVEYEMEPVSSQLAELKRSKGDGKHLANMLVQAGRYVNKILDEKRQQGTDEGGRDAAWWEESLWQYVADHMPKGNPTPAQVREWYEKREAVLKKKAEERRSSTPRD